MMYGGWFQIAFERDLKGELTTVRVGALRLLCVRNRDGIEVYDGVCPHRGADLGVGGRLVDGEVICNYHGHRIALGRPRHSLFSVRRYRSFTIGGLVFALVGRAEVGELPDVLKELEATHHIVPGFEKSMRVAPELVVENAFDADHFGPVHDVIEAQASRPSIERGAFTVSTKLKVGPSRWQGGKAAANDSFVEVPLHSRAFSPNVIVTSIAIGGDHPHCVIAAGTPQPDGVTTTIRLSVAMPRLPDGSAPPREVADVLLQYESFGLEQDRPIWENLAADAIPRYRPTDSNVLEFRRFCQRFRIDRRAESRRDRSSERPRADDQSDEARDLLPAPEK